MRSPSTACLVGKAPAWSRICGRSPGLVAATCTTTNTAAFRSFGSVAHNCRSASTHTSLLGLCDSSDCRAKGNGAMSDRPARILVVDDHPDTRDAMARLLRREGYIVLAAGTCEAAIRSAADAPIDLLITDLLLP